jgi:4-hydroxy-tetrahydrodipicolinate reductase
MNIVLIGYGKMGQTIEALGIKQGHSFPLIIDETNLDELNPKSLRGIDAAIEFTMPAAAPLNIRKCIDLDLPVVCGTTGWNEKIPETESYCRAQGGSLFHASNFSLGVNILFSLNRKLARIMDQFPEYKVHIHETHHVHKKDAPSGTAISLAQQILEASSRLKGWSLTKDARTHDIEADQIPVDAERKGEIKGMHSIHYESLLDTIILSHDAHSRDTFAAGALLAARFLKGKKGVFGMQDLLNL